MRSQARNRRAWLPTLVVLFKKNHVVCAFNYLLGPASPVSSPRRETSKKAEGNRQTVYFRILTTFTIFLESYIVRAHAKYTHTRILMYTHVKIDRSRRTLTYTRLHTRTTSNKILFFVADKKKKKKTQKKKRRLKIFLKGLLRVIVFRSLSKKKKKKCLDASSLASFFRDCVTF